MDKTFFNHLEAGVKYNVSSINFQNIVGDYELRIHIIRAHAPSIVFHEEDTLATPLRVLVLVGLPQLLELGPRAHRHVQIAQ